MSIPVTCPQCGATNKVNDSLAGRRVRCPQCDTAVHVPEWDETAAPPPLPSDVPVETEAPAAESVEIPAAQPVTVEPAATPAVDTTPPADAAVSAFPSSPSPPAPPGDDDDDDDDDEPIFQKSKREEEELDMTPMVDVTFLLLIFFMVTAAFSLQKSIEMPRQQTDAPSTTVVEEEEEDLEMVEVQVDEFGSFLVLATDWQEETPGKQNLITTLKRANESGNPARLVIKVHELCKLQYLVDAMDAGTIAGFTETQVTQVEEFD
ncbi:Biopolymer transport protein ExbD/TolR [Stieleria maiorica]|uniref:Biopolymer transport protein ExbD/TolR n=1 Tax=Stieleria maiorica TaxID=2795974 RepID=A0A5B9M6C8_9BACT|nr:biopolymer transporter ExbD [Stieleria maiorica]QEF96379.1 Biopolymer transport protein ExbD/TolR [Stieleria maiorica]